MSADVEDRDRTATSMDASTGNGVDDMPQPGSPPPLTATIRAIPEDFVVEEIDGFDASGSGEHLLLTVRKRGMTTTHAARCIAAWAGLDDRAIGFAGMKDRHAVTTQRFSVHLPRRIAPSINALHASDLQVLADEWHSRKLPRGALAGNRFVLTLRDVIGDGASIEDRLAMIAASGVPNYFGEQRFGRDGDNVATALAMFGGRRMPRDKRGILLSAARSALFNRVLAARVSDGSWNAGLKGEVWMLDGSHSVFGPEPWSDALAARLAAFDIHPTAPMWGAGVLRCADQALAVEQAALADARSQALCLGLEGAGLKQERRSTRLRPDALAWEWVDARALRLSFALPPGAYATTLLAALGTFANGSGHDSRRSSEIAA